MSAAVVARTIASIPQRTATDTWGQIVDLIAPDAISAARKDLDAVAGIACTCITDESLRDDPVVVHGNGPRVRVYCVYGDDAIEGDGVNDQPLSFVPTEGDWKLSLPCNEEDLPWVSRSLARVSSRVTARPLGQPPGDVAESNGNDPTARANAPSQIDIDAFLRH